MRRRSLTFEPRVCLALVGCVLACGPINPPDAIVVGDAGIVDGDAGTADDVQVQTRPLPRAQCYDSDTWTCVAVAPTERYGERTFRVPARQNWVATGLYLREGESALIDSTGTWNIGPRVNEEITHGSCRRGDLVARIGLHYEDENLTCIEGATLLVAHRNGIVFVGALAGDDGAEGYETRLQSTGHREVTIRSEARTTPTVVAASAEDYPFSEVDVDAVEIAGEHVILTLPTAFASKERRRLSAAIARLDAIYALQQSLRGRAPYFGQRIRFFPDGKISSSVVFGNPLRLDLHHVDVHSRSRISEAASEAGYLPAWTYAHGLGHTFAVAGGGWRYQERSAEAWPDIFTIFAVERLRLPMHPAAESCQPGDVARYRDWSTWQALCFLRQFQFSYGWDFYGAFFRALNTQAPENIPGNRQRWPFVHDLLEAATGHNVTPVFQAWGVPTHD